MFDIGILRYFKETFHLLFRLKQGGYCKKFSRYSSSSTYNKPQAFVSLQKQYTKNSAYISGKNLI